WVGFGRRPLARRRLRCTAFQSADCGISASGFMLLCRINRPKNRRSCRLWRAEKDAGPRRRKRSCRQFVRLPVESAAFQRLFSVQCFSSLPLTLNSDAKSMRQFPRQTDRCELTDTLSDLNWDIPAAHNTPLPRTPDAIASLPKLVILYIHGWQHSADKDDDNLKSFESQIRNIREANREKKNVVGIYIGWNALGGSFPLNYLLFWSKETIADRIAQSSSVTEIVSAIGAILDRK